MFDRLRIAASPFPALVAVIFVGLTLLDFGLGLEETPLVILFAFASLLAAAFVGVWLRRENAHLIESLRLLVEAPIYSFVTAFIVTALDGFLQYTLPFAPETLVWSLIQTRNATFLLTQSSALPLGFLLWVTLGASLVFLALIVLTFSNIQTARSVLSQHRRKAVVGILVASLPSLVLFASSGFDPSALLFGPARWPDLPFFPVMFSAIGLGGSILFAKGSRSNAAAWNKIAKDHGSDLLLVGAALVVGYFFDVWYYPASLRELLGSFAFAVKSIYVFAASCLLLLAAILHTSHVWTPRRDAAFPFYALLPTAISSIPLVVLFFKRLPAYEATATFSETATMAVLLAVYASFLVAYLFGALFGVIGLRLLLNPFLKVCLLFVRLKRYLQLEGRKPHITLARSSIHPNYTTSRVFLYYLSELGIYTSWVIVFFIEELRTLTLSSLGLWLWPLSEFEWRYFAYFFSDLYWAEPAAFNAIINEAIFSDLVIPVIVLPVVGVTLMILAELGGVYLDGKPLSPKLLHRFLSLVILSSFIIKISTGWYGVDVFSRVVISLLMLSVPLSGFAAALALMKDYVHEHIPAYVKATA